jgi:hypothetical protein
MNARAGPGDSIDPRDGDGLNVGDPVLRKTRLLSRQCATCIFRPGNPMSLAPGRLRDLVNQARARGSFVICHETLPCADPPTQCPGEVPPSCRGFHDRYDTAALQTARRLWGFVDVDPSTSVSAEPVLVILTAPLVGSVDPSH